MMGASNLLLKELDGLSFIESVRMKHILYDSFWPSFEQQVVLKVSLLTRWFYNYLAVSCQVGRHHNSTQQAWRSQAMLNVCFVSFDVLFATHVFITSNNFPFILSSTSTLQHVRRLWQILRLTSDPPLSVPDHVIEPDNDDGDESWLWESLSWSWLTPTSSGTRTSSAHPITGHKTPMFFLTQWRF